MIAAHEDRHRLPASRRVERRLDETLAWQTEERAHLLHAALAWRRDALEPAAAGACRRRGTHLRLLDVRRVPAALARDDRILAGRREHLELVRQRAADRARTRLDGAEREPAALEDAGVGVEHHPVLAPRVVRVDVKRIRVLHDEFAAAHEAEARADLVAELDLDLIEVLRQLAVGADLTAHEVGHDFLVRRAEAELAVVAVAHAEELRPVALPAPALAPELARNDRRHQDLLGAGAVHLLADDRLHPPDGSQPEREQVINAARHLADHAGADHEAVARDLGVGRVLAQRRHQQPREPRHALCSSRHCSASPP